MSDQKEKKGFVCPHCGETTGVTLAASGVRELVFSPDGDESFIGGEIPEVDIDYDVVSCIDCCQDVECPEWAMQLIINADKADSRVGKARFTDTHSR